MTIETLSLLAGERADMLVDDGTGNFVLADNQIKLAVFGYINYEFSAMWDVLVNANEDLSLIHI